MRGQSGDVEAIALGWNTMKKNFVCATCGSTNVLADAYCDWNIDNQRWEIVNVFEKGAVCEDCKGSCRLEERIVDESGDVKELDID